MFTTKAGTPLVLISPLVEGTDRVICAADLGLNGYMIVSISVDDVAPETLGELAAANELIKQKATFDPAGWKSPFDTGLVYDQPAEPTDEDVRRVLRMDYPTVYAANGAGCIENAGLMSAFFSTLAAVETAKERAAQSAP